MKVNLKFMGVDLLDSMSAIVERHTEHYKTDFYTHDRNTLREAAQKHGQDERRFLWHLASERAQRLSPQYV